MSTRSPSERKSVLFAHVIGWLIFLVAPILLSPDPGLSGLIKPDVIFPSMARTTILIILFYLNLNYIVPEILQKRGVFFFLITLIVAVVLVSMLNEWIHVHYTQRPGPPLQPPPDFHRGPPRPRGMMLAGPMLSSLLITIMVVSVSTTIALWKDWNRVRQEEQDRALQKVASELAVLKLQISPHFLFNTLNNIRWLVRSKSDQAEEAVVRLSQLLRYILYQTNSEKVGLEQEIENLRDFMSLQSMRLAKSSNVVFNVTGNPQGKQIVPLLFIPLAENFFKHGDFSGEERNEMSIHISDDRILLKSVNRILKQQSSVEESGIGLTNVRKRLALHYPDRHHLDYSEENGSFVLKLEILLA